MSRVHLYPVVMILVKCKRIRRLIYLRIRLERIKTCLSESSYTLQIGDRRRITSTMASSVVPGRFNGGDFDHWLRHFNRCAIANGWDNAARLVKLSAFLQGPAATFYDTLADEAKDTYAHLTASLRDCFKPSVHRERYYEDFHSQELRPSENPSLFLWRLQELLHTAEPDLSKDAFNALLRRQFMRGLPRHLRLKLLESDPTPDLDKVVKFAQRFHALDALP